MKTCVNCGGEAGIDTVETKDGTAHYSAHECVSHLKTENAGLRKVVAFLQEGVCRHACFPENNFHVGDCERASEMMRGLRVVVKGGARECDVTSGKCACGGWH